MKIYIHSIIKVLPYFTTLWTAEDCWQIHINHHIKPGDIGWECSFYTAITFTPQHVTCTSCDMCIRHVCSESLLTLMNSDLNTREGEITFNVPQN